MRRFTLLFLLTLLLSLLTGCAPQPDLTGHWETAAGETLCPTALWLNIDGTFLHIQEGRTAEGTWTLKDTRLILTVTPVHELDSGSMFTYTLDKATGMLNTNDGLHLSRQPAPRIAGYWMNATDDAPYRCSLHLMTSGLFYLEMHDGMAIDLTQLDGGCQKDGRWALGGLVLNLYCSDRSVITCRLSPDGRTLDMGNGVILTNYMTQ